MMANMFRDEGRRLATIGFCLGGMAAGVLLGYPLGSLLYDWFGRQVLFYIIIFATILLLSKYCEQKKIRTRSSSIRTNEANRPRSSIKAYHN